MSSKHTRDELLYLAKLAEQCERYDGKSLAWSLAEVKGLVVCRRDG